MMFRKSFFITTCTVDILPNEPAVPSVTINYETRFKENRCVRRVKTVSRLS